MRPSKKFKLFLAAILLTAAPASADVAGSFYPSDPKELSLMIEGFLSKVPAAPVTGLKPLLIIVPHAGYVYSGQTAAYAFKLLQGFHYDTVVMIGVCHRVPLPGAAVWRSGPWRTPLGETPVDTELGDAIAAESPQLSYGEAAFAGEHSLEVELPFLQSTLKDFKIVPILISESSDAFTDTLAAALAKHLKSKNVLVLVSTDLSHYHNDAAARLMDSLALQYIRKADGVGLLQAQRQGKAELCGVAATTTALKLAQAMGWTAPMTLKYSTSADATGDKSRVVGYGSAVIYPQAARAPLTADQKKRLVEIARLTLDRFVRVGERPVFSEADPALTEVRGAFVTLKKNGSLRGCIGSVVGAEPLYVTVGRMTTAAASEDPRFSRVRPEELKNITVEVSALTPLEKIVTVEAFKLGRHGVVLENAGHKGIFLPQVAEETGWSKEEFLSELCTQKAGLPERCWEDPKTKLFVFEAEVFSQ